MENLRWIAAAALSAYACQLAVVQTTPVDRALPLLAVAATFLAWRSYPALMLTVPLLIAAEIALPAEEPRLLAFGAVLGASFAISLACGDDSTDRRRRLELSAPAVAFAAVLVLRWIPWSDVLVWRELAVLAMAVATVLVLGNTPFAVLVATFAALVAPGVPLRTLGVPALVLIVAALARFFGMPRLRLVWPSTLLVGFMVLFFAWSGVLARAFPLMLRRATAASPRTVVAQALAPNRSEVYAVPPGAKALVVSGANVAHLGRGTLLGRIDPGAIAVRIGDAADWGYMRRDHFYRAQNPLPRDSAGVLRGYGYSAWVDGAGRVALPAGVHTIRVTADGALPRDASLQVEGFE